MYVFRSTAILCITTCDIQPPYTLSQEKNTLTFEDKMHYF